MPRKKKTDVETELMKETVEEAEGNQTPELEAMPTEPAPQEGIALNDLKIGYVVGLSQEGNFVFDLFGSDKGLVELLGIHEHASFRVRRIYEDAQVSGDRLTHEVGKAVALVNQKIDAILQAMRGGPQRRPDNSVPGGPQGQVPQGPRPVPQQARPATGPQQRQQRAAKKQS